MNTLFPVKQETTVIYNLAKFMRISHFLFQLNFYKQFLTGKTLHRDTINVLRNNSEKITRETGLNFLVFTYLHYFVLKRERKLRVEREKERERDENEKC